MNAVTRKGLSNQNGPPNQPPEIPGAAEEVQVVPPFAIDEGADARAGQDGANIAPADANPDLDPNDYHNNRPAPNNKKRNNIGQSLAPRLNWDPRSNAVPQPLLKHVAPLRGRSIQFTPANGGRFPHLSDDQKRTFVCTDPKCVVCGEMLNPWDVSLSHSTLHGMCSLTTCLVATKGRLVHGISCTTLLRWGLTQDEFKQVVITNDNDEMVCGLCGDTFSEEEKKNNVDQHHDHRVEDDPNAGSNKKQRKKAGLLYPTHNSCNKCVGKLENVLGYDASKVADKLEAIAVNVRKSETTYQNRSYAFYPRGSRQSTLDRYKKRKKAAKVSVDKDDDAPAAKDKASNVEIGEVDVKPAAQLSPDDIEKLLTEVACLRIHNAELTTENAKLMAKLEPTTKTGMKRKSPGSDE